MPRSVAVQINTVLSKNHYKNINEDGKKDENNKLVKMKIVHYENSECFVSTENGNKPFFKIMSGVRRDVSYPHSCLLLSGTIF